MNKIKKKLFLLLLNNFIFNMIISTTFLIVSIILFNYFDFFKYIIVVAVSYFLIVIGLFLNKFFILNHFMNEILDLNVENAKFIENAIFLEACILSYSYMKPVKIFYSDIKLASHNKNVFEITRPGYKGNHKVFIESSDQEMIIPVEGNIIAQKILNFLQTKNDKIAFQNKSEETETVQLSELENWTVNSRF